MTQDAKPDLSAHLARIAAGPSAEDEAYDIRIAADGTWFYQGTPIGRIALCKLFATVLRRDDDGAFWLITPAERGRITVEDAPFIATAVDAPDDPAHPDGAMVFRTNLDHEVVAGPGHPISVRYDGDDDTPRPYILIDRTKGLEALIARPVFYELVDRAVPHEDRIGVWSEGRFFPLDRDPPPTAG